MKQVSLPPNFSYNDLLEIYTQNTVGRREPNRMVFSLANFLKVKNMFHLQQKYSITYNIAQYVGMKFMDAIVSWTHYVPDDRVELDFNEYDEFTEWVREIRRENGIQEKEEE